MHTLSIFSRDLLGQLDEAITRIDEAYEQYRFSEVAQTLYDFVWGSFCDRFIEAAKADFTDPVRRDGTLATIDYTLRQVLRLLHPYAPFITEELWQGLGFSTETIQYAPWPTAGTAKREPRAEAVHRAVAAARNLRATYNIPSNKKLPWLLQPSVDWIKDEYAVLRLFLNAEKIETVDAPPAGLMAACPTDIGVLYLSLEGVIDAPAERKRLAVEIGKVVSEIEKVDRKLASESFVQNAPADVVADHRQRRDDWKSRLEALKIAQGNLN